VYSVQLVILNMLQHGVMSNVPWQGSYIGIWKSGRWEVTRLEHVWVVFFKVPVIQKALLFNPRCRVSNMYGRPPLKCQ
jgi:hypothetical protein